MILRPCWSCGADNAPCVEDCQCAKCLDPHGYAAWRATYPHEYAAWLESQRARGA
jgi:hypothetical protein